jgi:hypothetical protein
MRGEEYEESLRRAQRLAVGLLGTREKPTKLADFLDVYIELEKEHTAMAIDEIGYQGHKGQLTATLKLVEDIKEWERAEIQKRKEEENRHPRKRRLNKRLRTKEGGQSGVKTRHGTTS